MKPLRSSDYFIRQTTLDAFGPDGQERLQKAKVLIVGCGGLGSPIAIYLATSGVGAIHLVDFDKVSVSNLHRQVFYTPEDVGAYKAEVLVKQLQLRTPFTQVSYSCQPLDKSNVLEIVSAYDLVIDATDSLPTKYLINDACVLQNKPLVYGSLYKFDGYVAVFNKALQDGSRSAHLRDAFPKMATDVPTCASVGTLNPIVGIIAMHQANEAIKLISGIGTPLVNTLFIYNSLQNTQLQIKLQPKTSREAVAALFKATSYIDPSCEVQRPEWLISTSDFLSQLKITEFNVIVVSKDLPEALPFPVLYHIPLSELTVDALELDPTKNYVIICQKGISSYRATTALKGKYPEVSIRSLAGGFHSLHLL